MSIALTHPERLTAHDAVVSIRCMMNAPSPGSPEELEEAMATLESLYDVMFVQAVQAGDEPFLNDLAVWMERNRRQKAVEQARQYLETLPPQPEPKRVRP